MDDCLRERYVVVDDFLPEEDCLSMREDIDRHFSAPASHRPATHQVWNYWHVPGLYTYLRTSPEKVIRNEKVEAFVERLRTWTAMTLGLAGVTLPYLSLYVPGCVQGLHNDSNNGRLGYVYSLTRNDRKTIGGETVLVQDRDLFRGNLDRAEAGVGLYDLVPPQFNRLTLFDDRIPHAVQRIEGSMDPLEGRFVLHGHVSEAGVVAQGEIAANVIEDEVVEVLVDLWSGPGEGVHGPLVFSIEIAPSGEIEQIRPIFDRLATNDSVDLDSVRAVAAERIQALRFPEGSSPTLANIPLIFGAAPEGG